MINATLLDGLEKVLSNSYIEQISPCKIVGDRLDVDIKTGGLYWHVCVVGEIALGDGLYSIVRPKLSHKK